MALDQALGHTYQYWMNTAWPVASQNWNSLFLSRDNLSDGSRRFRETTAKSDYLLRHAYLFRLSVCPHRTTRLPLDIFSWNFILVIFTNFVDQIQVSLKSHNVRGTLHEDLRTFIFNFIMETGSLRCELRSQAEETVDDRQITTEANCVICEVPDKAEERVNDLNITIDNHRI